MFQRFLQVRPSGWTTFPRLNHSLSWCLLPEKIMYVHACVCTHAQFNQGAPEREHKTLVWCLTHSTLCWVGVSAPHHTLIQGCQSAKATVGGFSCVTAFPPLPGLWRRGRTASLSCTCKQVAPVAIWVPRYGRRRLFTKGLIKITASLLLTQKSQR